MSITLYDASNVDNLRWPTTEEGKLAKHHLLPLIKEGPEHFIENAKTHLYLLTLDDLIIPLSVNETEYRNCYLLSSYFVVAHLQEKLEKNQSLLKQILKPFIGLFGALLKWIKINKVVIINNWLLTTNPYPELSKSQLKTIISFLKKHFPDHYFMFRSVNTYKSSAVFDALNLEQFRLIPCRQVYLYDPTLTSKLPPSVIRKQKKDTNRIANKKYIIETATSLSKEEIQHLLQLYRNVYVNKYTQYSPLYTEKYLHHILQTETIRLKLLKKEGKIYGVAGFLQKNGFLLVPFFGYDTSLPQDEGVYRMLSAIIMQEIEEGNLVSHQGTGAAQFKKWRGFFEHLEYVGIYDRHLPFLRRTFWTLSEKFSPLFLAKGTSSEYE